MVTPIIELNGETLTINDIIAITRGKNLVRISDEALKKVKHSADIIKNVVEEKRKIYGVTTGFGYLQNVTISLDDVQKLQENLIVSHSAGVGEEFPDEIVKGAMVLQINKFARGHSGIRPQVISLLLEILNKNIIPIVPSKGSLGASGDLAPLAHLSLVLIGKGFAYYNGERLSGSEALTKAGLNSIKLVAKEGLALLNGTQIMTSIAAIVVADAEYLIKIANLTTAMSMEVHCANIDAFNPLIQQARPHKLQVVHESSLHYKSYLL
jgi:histidine ammonia-lyase